MIRRDIRLPDGAAGWMLISQIEHARVSEQLAQLAASCPTPAPPAQLGALRAEILAAIRHHDDGWAEWERAPQLDPATGRPLAFTELNHVDAIEVWARSIDAVGRFGPLASWMVAGHFLRLARHATTPAEPAFIAWQAEMEVRRREWLAAWQQVDPKNHTPALAADALQWLWTFDEASLWLCCTCQENEPIPCAPEPYRVGRGTPLEMEFSAIGVETATAQPWRFSTGEFDISIAGQAIPVARYRTAAELLAAARPHTLRWRLAGA